MRMLPALMAALLLPALAAAGSLVDPRHPGFQQLEPLVITHGHLRMCQLMQESDPRPFEALETILTGYVDFFRSRERIRLLGLACRSEPGPEGQAARRELEKAGLGKQLADADFRQAVDDYVNRTGSYAAGEALYRKACSHLEAVRAGQKVSPEEQARRAEEDPMLWALRFVGQQVLIRAVQPEGK